MSRWLCACLLLVATPAFAGKNPKPPKQEERPPAASAAAPASAPGEIRPVNLWRVEKPGQPASYLFGTCHQGVGLDQALPAEHEALIHSSQQLVVEIALAEMFEPAVQAMFQLPEGQSLRALVGDPAWGSLVQIVGDEAAAARLNRLHPAIAALGLAQQLVQPEVDGVPALGLMDVAIAGVAQRGGVPIRQLEKPEDQVRALLGGDMSTHVDGLKALIDPVGRAKLTAETNAMLGACRTGVHGPAIEAIEQSPPAWRAAVFDSRNEAWIPKLEAHFAAGSTFAAVGVGHLIGAGSVVERLEARGYTLTRLSGAVSAGRDPHAPVTLAEWLEVMSDHMPTFLCGPGAVSSCLDVSMATCRDAFTASVDACAKRMALPDPMPMAEGAKHGASLGGCTQAVGLQALRAHIRDTLSCAALTP